MCSNQVSHWSHDACTVNCNWSGENWKTKLQALVEPWLRIVAAAVGKKAFHRTKQHQTSEENKSTAQAMIEQS